VENNRTVENRGNGIYLRDFFRATLDNNTIRNNSGGIAVRDDSGLMASGNEITGTESSFEGIFEILQKTLLKN